MTEVFLFTGSLSLGDKARVARVARRLRQTDLAQLARVAQTDVSRLERDFQVRPSAERRLLEQLGLLGDGIEHYQKMMSAYEGAPHVWRHFRRRLMLLQNGKGASDHD